MAEITYEPTEWADFEQGGTPITAASLNHMEGGIAGAIRGVNTLTEDRLQTYRVSQDGDTATQDVSGNAIVGPCLIYDEAINGTYYEPSSDVGDRVLMVSANQIKALQDSVSQTVLNLNSLTTLMTRQGSNRISFGWSNSKQLEIYIGETKVHTIVPNWGNAQHSVSSTSQWVTDRKAINAIYYDTGQKCMILDLTRDVSSGKKRHYMIRIYENGDVNGTVWE